MQIPRPSRIATVTLLTAAWVWFIPAGMAQTPLHVGSAVCAQFEDGPPLGALRLVPGEIVYFSFIADNFKKSDTGKVALTGHAQVFDPGGIPVSPKEEILILTILSEEDKNWKPKLRAEFALPPIAPPGTYTVRYDATDEQSHQAASGEATFEVEAKFVAPSNVLSVRELNFYRNQDDTTALITPTFRPGDMVWVKFFIVGYKIGEQNSIDAGYDVELLAADGTSIMKKEDAAMEKSTAYYPQPYVPAIFNLALKATMTRSVYTLVITAHDANGNQTATARSKFQVN